MTRRPDDAGFTLLEILVALVVLGLLLAGLAQSVQFGLRAWAIEARIVDRSGDLDAVARAWRRLVEQMDPGTYAEPPYVKGTATTAAFTTMLPIASGALATRRAEVALAVDRAHRLVLRWRPHPHVTETEKPKPEETELLRGVSRIALSYWQMNANGGTWLDAWTDSRTLPVLVRLRVFFLPGDPRHWPDLVAAPIRDLPEG